MSIIDGLDSGFDTSYGGGSYNWGSNVWDSLGAGVSGGAAPTSGWDSLLKNLGTPGNVASIGSSIYGFMQSQQLADMAKTAFGQSDPFAQYRPGYGAQLQQLMANPSSVTSLPGYQAQFGQGIQAVSRGMGSKGYLESGNMATALMDYGNKFEGDYYNNEVQRLSSLAGAGIQPSPAGTGITGLNAASNLSSSALASLGYTMGKNGGASAGTPGGFSTAGGVAADAGSVAKLGAKITGSPGLTTAADALGGVGSAFGVVQGVSNGNPVEGLGSAANLARLGGKYLTGSSPGVASALGGSAAALGYGAALFAAVGIGNQLLGNNDPYVLNPASGVTYDPATGKATNGAFSANFNQKSGLLYNTNGSSYTDSSGKTYNIPLLNGRTGNSSRGVYSYLQGQGAQVGSMDDFTNQWNTFLSSAHN